uniref:Secreted protein n=1 Tax=Mesocestoides corti TaxID=53468 RepID=A0A5K3G056_MESCO
MHRLPSRVLCPSSSTSSRSHLLRWSSMPSHSYRAVYSPALAPSLSRSQRLLSDWNCPWLCHQLEQQQLRLQTFHSHECTTLLY